MWGDNLMCFIFFWISTCVELLFLIYCVSFFSEFFSVLNSFFHICWPFVYLLWEKRLCSGFVSPLMFLLLIIGILLYPNISSCQIWQKYSHSVSIVYSFFPDLWCTQFEFWCNPIYLLSFLLPLLLVSVTKLLLKSVFLKVFFFFFIFPRRSYGFGPNG